MSLQQDKDQDMNEVVDQPEFKNIEESGSKSDEQEMNS